MNKIFGHQAEAKSPAPAAATAVPQPLATPATPSGQPASTAPPPPLEPVDVAVVLDDLAKHNPEKLAWRTSIVDLMKLVGMDSSLASRKELADDLGFAGDKGDSAKMNIWLHKEVLKKLAANGGKVPPELL